MQKLGLEGMSIETDDDVRRVMKLIRAMPRSMTVKREMR